MNVGGGLDAQLIRCIFRHPLHVSDISRPISRRYNRMYTTVGVRRVHLEHTVYALRGADSKNEFILTQIT
jgi:hypothetical protein